MLRIGAMVAELTVEQCRCDTRMEVNLPTSCGRVPAALD